MSSYNILWKRSAEKDLRKLPKPAIQKILVKVESLQDNPFPARTRKLVGSDHTYRMRVGDYRIIYSVFSNILTIEIVRVGHRKDIYR